MIGQGDSEKVKRTLEENMRKYKADIIKERRKNKANKKGEKQGRMIKICTRMRGIL